LVNFSLLLRGGECLNATVFFSKAGYKKMQSNPRC
jgi:hypothetical protein